MKQWMMAVLLAVVAAGCTSTSTMTEALRYEREPLEDLSAATGKVVAVAPLVDVRTEPAIESGSAMFWNFVPLVIYTTKVEARPEMTRAPFDFEPSPNYKPDDNSLATAIPRLLVEELVSTGRAGNAVYGEPAEMEKFQEREAKLKAEIASLEARIASLHAEVKALNGKQADLAQHRLDLAAKKDADVASMKAKQAELTKTRDANVAELNAEIDKVLAPKDALAQSKSEKVAAMRQDGVVGEVKDALRTEINALDDKMDELDDKIADLKGQIKRLDKNLKSDLKEVDEKIDDLNDQLKDDLKAADKQDKDLDAQIAATKSQLDLPEATLMERRAALAELEVQMAALQKADLVLRGELVKATLTQRRYSYGLSVAMAAAYLLGAPVNKYEASLQVDWQLFDAKTGAPVGPKKTATVEEPVTRFSGFYYGYSTCGQSTPFGLYVDAVKQVNAAIAHGLSEQLAE
jgi:predicted  nucleic acid-binding Zn-ribbon protein